MAEIPLEETAQSADMPEAPTKSPESSESGDVPKFSDMSDNDIGKMIDASEDNISDQTGQDFKLNDEQRQQAHNDIRSGLEDIDAGNEQATAGEQVTEVGGEAVEKVAEGVEMAADAVQKAVKKSIEMVAKVVATAVVTAVVTAVAAIATVTTGVGGVAVEGGGLVAEGGMVAGEGGMVAGEAGAVGAEGATAGAEMGAEGAEMGAEGASEAGDVASQAKDAGGDMDMDQLKEGKKALDKKSGDKGSKESKAEPEEEAAPKSVTASMVDCVVKAIGKLSLDPTQIQSLAKSSMPAKEDLEGMGESLGSGSSASKTPELKLTPDGK